VAYSVIPVTVPPRRFPPPWSGEEIDAYFIVRDANGQALTYVYGEDEPGHTESRQRPAEDGGFGASNLPPFANAVISITLTVARPWHAFRRRAEGSLHYISQSPRPRLCSR
jgi:hypothetical protein